MSNTKRENQVFHEAGLTETLNTTDNLKDLVKLLRKNDKNRKNLYFNRNFIIC